MQDIKNNTINIHARYQIGKQGKYMGYQVTVCKNETVQMNIEVGESETQDRT